MKEPDDSMIQYVGSAIEACSKVLHVSGWEIGYILEDAGLAGDLAMSINVDNSYLRATIVIDRPYLEETYSKKDAAHIYEHIMHELAHILTEPLYVIAVDAATNGTLKFIEEYRESLTERVARFAMASTPKDFIPKINEEVEEI